MSQLFDHGYAVVIGIDENNIARLNLPTVAKDVKAIYDVLVHPERCAYHPDHVQLVSGQEATKKNILDALYWLQEKVAADPQATAVIYYSGHGMEDKESKQYYLIPYDIRSIGRVRADAVKAEELTAEIGAINARRLLVVLDCCHAAGLDIKDIDPQTTAAVPDVTARAFPLELQETKDIPEFAGGPDSKDVSDLLEGEGRAVLNSSTGAESSYVRRDRTMSLFTFHLVEALTGHAPHADDATVVYVTDVMSWVTHEVKKSAVTEGVQQTPVMRTSGVFPLAQLMGGKGVNLAKGEAAPDPREPLPQVGTVEGSQVSGGVNTGGGDFAGRDIDNSTSVTFNQGGQTVGGSQTNIGEVGGDIGHIGDVISGDNIHVGDISGSTGVAIGRGSQSTVGGIPRPAPSAPAPGGDYYEAFLDEGVAMSAPPGSEEEIAYEAAPAEESAPPVAVPAVINQARRLEAAMPNAVRVNQTTELLVMLPRQESEGLSAELPIETLAGETIDRADVSEHAALVTFTAPDVPRVLYIYVTGSKNDFEIEDPFRAVLVYADRDGDFETFFLTPLRPLDRAPVTVRLYEDEGRTKPISTIRLATAITADEDDQPFIRTIRDAVSYAAAAGPVTINYSYVGGDSIQADIEGSSGVAIGEGAGAQVSGTQSLQIARHFTPLLALVAREAAGDAQIAAIVNVQHLQEEVERGPAADDVRTANLIQNLVETVPGTKAVIVELFAYPETSSSLGQAARFVIGRLKDNR